LSRFTARHIIQFFLGPKAYYTSFCWSYF